MAPKEGTLHIVLVEGSIAQRLVIGDSLALCGIWCTIFETPSQAIDFLDFLSRKGSGSELPDVANDSSNSSQSIPIPGSPLLPKSVLEAVGPFENPGTGGDIRTTPYLDVDGIPAEHESRKEEEDLVCKQHAATVSVAAISRGRNARRSFAAMRSSSGENRHLPRHGYHPVNQRWQYTAASSHMLSAPSKHRKRNLVRVCRGQHAGGGRLLRSPLEDVHLVLCDISFSDEKEVLRLLMYTQNSSIAPRTSIPFLLLASPEEPAANISRILAAGASGCLRTPLGVNDAASLWTYANSKPQSPAAKGGNGYTAGADKPDPLPLDEDKNCNDQADGLTHVYEQLGIIGRGATSIIYLVRRLSDLKLLALKEICLGVFSPRERAMTMNEIAIMRHLGDPPMISYTDSWLEGDTLKIIMEYPGGGTLYDCIQIYKKLRKPIPFELIAKWTASLAVGLEILHMHNIIHRDLKGQNVLLTEDLDIRLCDFGVSKLLSAKTMMARTAIGTPFFMSPEVSSGTPYSTPSDLWALGVLLYEVLHLRRPFDGMSIQALFQAIQNVEPIWHGYSNCDDFCVAEAGCLESDREIETLSHVRLSSLAVHQDPSELAVTKRVVRCHSMSDFRRMPFASAEERTSRHLREMLHEEHKYAKGGQFVSSSEERQHTKCCFLASRRRQQLQKLIKLLLCKNPLDRPTALDVCCHPLIILDTVKLLQSAKSPSSVALQLNVVNHLKKAGFKWALDQPAPIKSFLPRLVDSAPEQTILRKLDYRNGLSSGNCPTPRPVPLEAHLSRTVNSTPQVERDIPERCIKGNKYVLPEIECPTTETSGRMVSGQNLRPWHSQSGCHLDPADAPQYIALQNWELDQPTVGRLKAPDYVKGRAVPIVDRTHRTPRDAIRLGKAHALNIGTSASTQDIMIYRAVATAHSPVSSPLMTLSSALNTPTDERRSSFLNAQQTASATGDDVKKLLATPAVSTLVYSERIVEEDESGLDVQKMGEGYGYCTTSDDRLAYWTPQSVINAHADCPVTLRTLAYILHRHSLRLPPVPPQNSKLNMVDSQFYDVVFTTEPLISPGLWELAAACFGLWGNEEPSGVSECKLSKRRGLSKTNIRLHLVIQLDDDPLFISIALLRAYCNMLGTESARSTPLSCCSLCSCTAFEFPPELVNNDVLALQKSESFCEINRHISSMAALETSRLTNIPVYARLAFAMNMAQLVQRRSFIMGGDQGVNRVGDPLYDTGSLRSRYSMLTKLSGCQVVAYTGAATLLGVLLAILAGHGASPAHVLSSALSLSVLFATGACLWFLRPKRPLEGTPENACCQMSPWFMCQAVLYGKPLSASILSKYLSTSSPTEAFGWRIGDPRALCFMLGGCCGFFPLLAFDAFLPVFFDHFRDIDVQLSAFVREYLATHVRARRGEIILPAFFLTYASLFYSTQRIYFWQQSAQPPPKRTVRGSDGSAERLLLPASPLRVDETPFSGHFESLDVGGRYISTKLGRSTDSEHTMKTLRHGLQHTHLSVPSIRPRVTHEDSDVACHPHRCDPAIQRGRSAFNRMYSGARFPIKGLENRMVRPTADGGFLRKKDPVGFPAQEIYCMPPRTAHSSCSFGASSFGRPKSPSVLNDEQHSTSLPRCYEAALLERPAAEQPASLEALLSNGEHLVRSGLPKEEPLPQLNRAVSRDTWKPKDPFLAALMKRQVPKESTPAVAPAGDTSTKSMESKWVVADESVDGASWRTERGRPGANLSEALASDHFSASGYDQSDNVLRHSPQLHALGCGLQPQTWKFQGHAFATIKGVEARAQSQSSASRTPALGYKGLEQNEQREGRRHSGLGGTGRTNEVSASPQLMTSAFSARRALWSKKADILDWLVPRCTCGALNAANNWFKSEDPRRSPISNCAQACCTCVDRALKRAVKPDSENSQSWATLLMEQRVEALAGGTNGSHCPMGRYCRRLSSANEAQRTSRSLPGEFCVPCPPAPSPAYENLNKQARETSQRFTLIWWLAQHRAVDLLLAPELVNDCIQGWMEWKPYIVEPVPLGTHPFAP
ncbi:NEK kinase [Cyclospora cayetanensis]|uniref:non-specific serine/threonine protein kinase n=1 Tax=Cyclospora cayetanensis TaxID=88456 RepID=A0A1D3DA74_9EIME|nr:NEK kinase [Cyclospora cayetanensis]